MAAGAVAMERLAASARRIHGFMSVIFAPLDPLPIAIRAQCDVAPLARRRPSGSAAFRCLYPWSLPPNPVMIFRMAERTKSQRRRNYGATYVTCHSQSGTDRPRKGEPASMPADVPGRGTGDQRPRHHHGGSLRPVRPKAGTTVPAVSGTGRPAVASAAIAASSPARPPPAALPFPSGATAPKLDPRIPGRGYRPLRPALSLHLLRRRPPGPASRHQRHRRDAPRRAAVRSTCRW